MTAGLPQRASVRRDQAMAGLAVACGWAVYLPLGSQYLVYLLLAAMALASLRQPGHLRALRQWPPLVPLCALWVLLVLSALWSTAAPEDRWSHAWHYGRLLFMPLIAMVCTANAGKRGLRHFIAASAVVAVLTILEHFGLLPTSPIWHSTTDANGNQRIATSLLLALGVVLALIEVFDARQPHRRRLVWLMAVLVIALALTLQDRRTGMVALPALLALLAVSWQRGRRHAAWRSSGLLLAVIALSALTWQQSATVQARFNEGLNELRTYQSTGVVATSWGMRLRMAETTLDMVREQPLLGHGLGSWVSQWRPRAAGGGPVLERQLTPHMEYLLIAEQAGLVGLGLWLWFLAACFRTSWQAGHAGDAALMVWLAVAWSGLFNVVVRDAKFALPLLMLAALATAAARISADPESASTGR